MTFAAFLLRLWHKKNWHIDTILLHAVQYVGESEFEQKN